MKTLRQILIFTFVLSSIVCRPAMMLAAEHGGSEMHEHGGAEMGSEPVATEAPENKAGVLMRAAEALLATGTPENAELANKLMDIANEK